jgi:hypothetical protein
MGVSEVKKKKQKKLTCGIIYFNKQNHASHHERT